MKCSETHLRQTHLHVNSISITVTWWEFLLTAGGSLTVGGVKIKSKKVERASQWRQHIYNMVFFRSCKSFINKPKSELFTVCGIKIVKSHIKVPSVQYCIVAVSVVVFSPEIWHKFESLSLVFSLACDVLFSSSHTVPFPPVFPASLELTEAFSIRLASLLYCYLKAPWIAPRVTRYLCQVKLDLHWLNIALTHCGPEKGVGGWGGGQRTTPFPSLTMIAVFFSPSWLWLTIFFLLFFFYYSKWRTLWSTQLDLPLFAWRSF